MTSLNIESVFGKSPATFDLIVERFTGLNVLTRLRLCLSRLKTSRPSGIAFASRREKVANV